MKITRKLLLTTGLAIVTVAMLGLLASDVPVKIRLAALVFANDDAPVEVLGQPPVGMELPWTPPGGGEEEDGEKDDRGPTWDEIKDLLRKEAEKIQDGSIELTELLQKWGIIPETPKTPEELMDLVYVQGIKRLEELNEKYGVDLPKLSVLDLLDKVPDIPGGNGSETWDFENGKLGTGFSFDADGIKNTTVLTIGNNFGIQFELGYNFDNGFGDWSTYEDIADKNIGDLMGGSPYLKISLYYTW